MSKKTKKGPHPHDKKEQQQIAGCPRCRGKEITTPRVDPSTIPDEAIPGFVPPEALAAATFVTGKTLHATDHVDAERIADENPGVLVTYPPLPDTSGLAPLEALAAAVADELLRRFAPERVVVRVVKPVVKPGGLDGTAGVSVSRP